MIIRNIRVNFLKILTGYGFYICCLFTSILCFASYIYLDEINGNKYSVFRALTSFDRTFMLSDTSFCSFEIVRKGAGSWLFLFIPIIAAFAFVPLVCDEYEAKSVRFEIFRSDKVGYYTSRFITGCLCGGLAVMLGFFVFVVAVHMLFPYIGEYEPELRQEYQDMLGMVDISFSKASYVMAILRKTGEMFLYGVVWAAPVMMLTSLIRNKYLVMCIPFFLKYVQNQTCAKINSAVIENPEKINPKLQEISSIVNPDALANLSSYGSDIGKILLYSASVVVVSFAVYIFLQNRRADSGE